VLYVGLDVHRRRTQVAVMDEGGHELFYRNVPNDPERLSEVLCGADPGTPVVFEATYGYVRHEAPYDRVGCKGPPAACRSRPLKLGAA
jgi:hypothetical protein